MCDSGDQTPNPTKVAKRAKLLITVEEVGDFAYMITYPCTPSPTDRCAVTWELNEYGAILMSAYHNCNMFPKCGSAQQTMRSLAEEAIHLKMHTALTRAEVAKIEEATKDKAGSVIL